MPIKIKRKSDGKIFSCPDSINPMTRVGELKKQLHINFKPATEHGCRILHNGKVLKSLHKLTHYGSYFKNNYFLNFKSFIYVFFFLFKEFKRILS